MKQIRNNKSNIMTAKNSEELSSSQLKRLQDELAKFPLGKVSHYRRNKMANSLSKELNTSNLVIRNWFKLNATKVKVITPKPVSEGTMNPRRSSPENVTVQDVRIIENKKIPSKPRSVSLEESSLEPNNSTSDDFLPPPPQNNTNDEELQSIKMKYEELLTEYREKAAYCDTLKEKCHDFIETYNNHNAEKEQEILDYKQKLSNKELEFQKLKESHDHQDSKVKNHILDLQKKIKEQNSTLLDTFEKLKFKEDLVQKKEDQRSSTELEKKMMESKQQQIYEHYRSTLTKKQSEVDEAEKISEELRQKCSTLEKKNSEGIDVLNQVKNELREKLNSRETQLNSIVTELENLRKVNKDLMKSGSNLEKEREAKSQINTELKQRVNILKEHLKSKTVELQWALDKQRELEKESKEKDVKISDLQDIIVKRETQIRDLEEHEERLQQAIKSSKDMDIQLASKMEQTIARKELECKSAITRKELECKAALERAQNLTRRAIQSYKELNVKKNKEISDLKNEVVNKTIQLEKNEIEIKSLNKDVEANRQEYESARRSIESYQELNGTKDKEISFLKNECRTMTLLLEQTDKEILELEKNGEVTQQFCENLKVKQLEISSENKALRGDLQTSQQLSTEKDIEINHLHRKLNTETFGRDAKISAQERELRTLNFRIEDQKQEFERELEKTNEIQLREESNRLKAEERIGELEAEVHLEAVKKVEIAKKLEDKMRLVKKLKAVLLYRPSDGLMGAEECFQQSTTRLQIAYNWPLSLRLGESPTKNFSPTVASLWFNETTGGLKRELENLTDQSFLPKKIFRKMEESQSWDMTGYCWPLVPVKTFLAKYEIQSLLAKSMKRKSPDCHMLERKKQRIIPELMWTQDHSTTTSSTVSPPVRVNSCQMIAELLLDLLFSH